MLYERQSETTEESISLELQDAANRQYVEQRGYDVVAVLTDPGISGRRWANRPGAIEALRMIEEREGDVLIVWKWSRLSRRRVDLAVAFDRIESAGGRVESSTEPIDTSHASGRLHRGMLGEIAVFTSESIGEGWKETHASRRARGVPATGGERYGYRRVRTTDTETGKVRTVGYEIDEGEGSRKSPAEALRLAYTWSIAGWGTHRITNELNRRGYRNIRGELFKSHGIWPLLDSGFATGLVVQRHHRRTQEEDATEYHEGVHPRIIDREVWEAYLRSRRARSFMPPRRASSPHVLSGLMRCGDCGGSMIAVGPANATSKTAPTWQCRRWRTLGSQWARCVTVTRHRAEQAVRDWLTRESAAIETAAANDRRLRRAQRRARTDAERARAHLGDLNRRLADLELSDLRTKAPDAWREARDRLLADLTEAQIALEEAEAAAARPSVEIRSTVGRLLSAWPVIGTTTLPPEDMRTMLAVLLRGVWVLPPERRGTPARLNVVPVWEDPPAIVGPAPGTAEDEDAAAGE